MLESFLVEGRQDISGPEGLRGLVYGQSVTDACMSWETTEPLLHQLADAVRARAQPSPTSGDLGRASSRHHCGRRTARVGGRGSSDCSPGPGGAPS